MQSSNEESLLDLSGACHGSSLREPMPHKALVGIGGGKLAQFDSQAEPPKRGLVKEPPQRLPANWRKIRGKVLAKVRNG